MLPFAFDRNTYLQTDYTPLQQEQLLSHILLLTLQNERLRNNHIQPKEHTFSLTPQQPNSQPQTVELQLKQIAIDNLTISYQAVQKNLSLREHKIQELEQTHKIYQINTSKEIYQLKMQLSNYKTKYEEELAQRGKNLEQEQEFQRVIRELEHHEEQRKSMVTQMSQNKDRMLNEMERSNKDIKRQMSGLREVLSRKDEECMQLRNALNDAPKMQELNRWIGKVKEYEEKQLQACARISQMGQDLCTVKQKHRKLQHEHKQLQKVKSDLQEAVTANKDSEDSMTIYFDRLSTYETVMKDLQSEIISLQARNKDLEQGRDGKLVEAQKQKEEAVRQWKVISAQMEKQRGLLHAMQDELDYLTKNAQQSRIPQQISSLPHHQSTSQQISTLNSIQSRIMQKIQKKQNEKSIRDISGSQASSRLNSHYPSHDHTSRDDAIKKSFIYNERVSHSTERLDTQQSKDSLPRERQVECVDCSSRGKVSRCSSMGRVSQPYSYRSQFQSSQNKMETTVVKDEKRMLMDKLNYLRPQQSLRLVEKNLTSLYSKNYRNMNSQGALKHNIKQQSQNKLSMAKIKLSQNKQNISQLLAKRYNNLNIIG